MFKCWILLKSVLGGVDGSLHFTLPSMNRLNQTELATFAILLFWSFFRDSLFLYFISRSSWSQYWAQEKWVLDDTKIHVHLKRKRDIYLCLPIIGEAFTHCMFAHPFIWEFCLSRSFRNIWWRKTSCDLRALFQAWVLSVNRHKGKMQ